MYNYLASLGDTFPVHPGGQGQGKNKMLQMIAALGGIFLLILLAWIVIDVSFHILLRLEDKRLKKTISRIMEDD